MALCSWVCFAAAGAIAAAMAVFAAVARLCALPHCGGGALSESLNVYVCPCSLDSTTRRIEFVTTPRITHKSP